MFRLTQLSLDNWKNFRHLILPIQNRMFVFGANATGKSNLLDAFRFLRDISHDGLQKAVHARGGLDTIRNIYSQDKSDVAIEATMHDDEADETWTYRLRIRANDESPDIVEVADETVWKDGAVLWQRDLPGGAAEDEWTRRFTHLEQPNMNAIFRQVFVFIRRITYVNVVPQVVREANAFRGAIEKEGLYGMNLLDTISHTAPEVRARRLEIISKVLDIIIPNFAGLTFALSPNGQPHLRMVQRAGERSAALHEDQFSDGTLRLIGILWFMLDGSGLLLLEEPELYLHSEIVRQLPMLVSSMQGGRSDAARQVVLSSHSYDLINSDTIDPSEIVMLIQAGEDTRAVLASSDASVNAKIQAGYTPADAVIPRIAPKAMTEGQQSLLDML